MVLRYCPLCNHDEFTKDYSRQEVYCNNCGLVVQSAFQYMGLEKIDNVIPFSAPVEARRGIHTRYRKAPVKPKNYRHNIPNSKLMRKGHR